MRTTTALLFAVVVVGLGSSAQASMITPGLYGWTRNSVNGRIDFVSISELNGSATYLFDMLIPNGYDAHDLTYDPTNGNFYGNLFRNGSPSLIAEINPVAMTMTSSAYSGLLADGVEGIEYYKEKGGVVVSSDGGGMNALYVVSHTGVVQETAIMHNIRDQDHLGANALGGELHVLDSNHPTNGFRINQWMAPFSVSPTLVGIYNGPADRYPEDLAINPFTNVIYSSDQFSLLRFNLISQQQEVVGDYNYNKPIWGIAAVGANAVPEPATMALLTLTGLGALGLRLRRRQSQQSAA